MPIAERMIHDVFDVFAIIEVVEEVIVERASHSVRNSQVNRVECAIHVSDEPENCGSESLEALLLVRVDSDI